MEKFQFPKTLKSQKIPIPKIFYKIFGIMLLGVFLLPACQKIKETPEPTAQTRFAKWQTWYNQESRKRTKNTSERLTGADTVWYQFEPKWEEAQTEALPEGNQIMFVPLHRNIRVRYTEQIGYIRRLVVYTDAQGNITSGFIGELFGGYADIQANEHLLLKSATENQLPIAFDGGIITYNLAYEQQTGTHYQQGVAVGEAFFKPQRRVQAKKDKSSSGGGGELPPFDWGIWFPIFFPASPTFIVAEPIDAIGGGGGGGTTTPIVVPDPSTFPLPTPPSLPPVFNPTSFEQLNTYDRIAYGVFKAAQNTSLSHLQKAAWQHKHNVKTNWKTITGIMAEAQVIKEFMTSTNSIGVQTVTAGFGLNFVSNPNCLQYAKDNTTVIHAPDNKTDMVLKVNTNSSEGTFNIPFFEGDQEDRGFFIGFNIREKQAHYEGPTNFVIEVKNVSKDNPKLLTIILTGFRQLILNPLSSNGHKPMLVIDKDSFLKAYDSGETGWKEAIDANIEDLKKLGGGVHLIQGLNSMTKATQDAVIKYIRENTAEPPASHYNGTPDEEENDNNELYH